MNVALYSRVSTEEQARHGLSIEAQQAALHDWAEKNGHTVVGEYVDAGISGKKPPAKRPALSQLFRDLEGGLAVDVLAFCKLDRFFRSVQLYYQAMDVLEKYRVAWQAIHEDYETVTASGRMKVNIMLSVAENEADRTGERIKAVFDHKVTLGQAITSALPLGFRIDGKTVVHDDNAPAALAAFEHYAAHGNKSRLRDMLQQEYGIRVSVTSITKMLQNRLYVGEYRNNPRYCEPIVSRELFERVQHDLDSRATRKTPSGRVYLFSGLVICKACGRRMSSIHTGEGRDYYRCHIGHGMYKDCSNHTYLRESVLEQEALAQLADAVTGARVRYASKQKKKPPVDTAAIRKKLERLKELYIEGDISKEKYRQQRDDLTAKLETPEPPRKPPKELTGENFKAEYATLTREKKKAFWRAIIDRVEVYDDSVDIFYTFDIQSGTDQMNSIISYMHNK